MTLRKIAISVVLLGAHTIVAQDHLTIDKAVINALENNPEIRRVELSIKRNEAMKAGTIDLPKTDISLLYGQYNSYRNDNNLTIAQRLPFPTVFRAQRGLARSRIDYSQLDYARTKATLTSTVRSSFNHLLYLQERESVLRSLDSIFSELLRIAQTQYRTGEGAQLHVIAAESKAMEVRNELVRNRTDQRTAYERLSLLCGVDGPRSVVGDLRNFLSYDSTALSPEASPALQMQKQQIDMISREHQLEVARTLPEFEIGYFTQTLIGPQVVDGVEQHFSGTDRFHGFQIGISLPLFFPPAKARIKGAAYALQVAEQEYAGADIRLRTEYTAAVMAVEKNKRSIGYYEDRALRHAGLLEDQSRKAFAQGELNYGAMLMNMEQALKIREGYLLSLYEYNESIISLLLLTGN